MQHGLGTFAEAFPLLLQLLEQSQPGGPLCELTVDFLEPPLGVAELPGQIGDRLLGDDRLAVGARFVGDGGLDSRLGFRRHLRCRHLGLPHALEILRDQVVLVHAGLLVDFVARAVGAQPRHRALELEQLELRLVELLLEPGQLALDDAELAIALLEDGIAAAEQLELRLLVGRTRIHLRRDFAQLHFDFAERVARRRQPVLEAAALDLRQVGRIFRRLALRAQVEHRLLRILHALIQPAAMRPLLGQRGLLRFKILPALVRRRPQRRHLRVQLAKRRGQLRVMIAAPGKRQMTQPVIEPLVTHRLRRLAAETADLPAHLADHVGDARHVLVRQRELLQRLTPLRLVLRDAGRLFEDRAPLLGLRRQDLVDLALRHDRVAGPANAGVHEKLLDVLQSARLAVERVLALPVAVHATHDLDLVKFAAELLLAIGQEQRNLAQLRRLPGVGPLEDDVLHLAAAQRLGALFAQHPADGIGNVRLAASVRAHDRGDPRFEPESGRVREAFKAMELERLEIHAGEKRPIEGPPSRPAMEKPERLFTVHSRP